MVPFVENGFFANSLIKLPYIIKEYLRLPTVYQPGEFFNLRSWYFSFGCSLESRKRNRDLYQQRNRMLFGGVITSPIYPTTLLLCSPLLLPFRPTELWVFSFLSKSVQIFVSRFSGVGVLINFLTQNETRVVHLPINNVFDVQRVSTLWTTCLSISGDTQCVRSAHRWCVHSVSPSPH